jgi:voltage-gated potassium channel
MEKTSTHMSMMARPLSWPMDTWNAVIAVAATIGASVVPAELVLGALSPWWFGPVIRGTTALFVVDLVVQWRLAGWQRGERAILSLDLLSALPLSVIPGLQFLSICQLAKLFRVRRFINRWRLQFMGQWNAFRFVSLVYWIGGSVHGLASGWVALRGMDPGEDVWTTYLRAWYYCTTTLTTIGYGDITPETNAETVYAIVIMIFGVAMYSYVIANVANLIANLHPSTVRYHETMERLSAFMNYRRIPKELQAKVREYHAHVWDQRLGYEESNFLDALPSGLMTEVTLYLRHDVIQKVPFLKGASEDLVRELALALRQAIVTPGEYIFRLGEHGNAMYFISEGNVEVTGKDGTEVIATLGEGDFFGEMALLLNRPRTASVRSVGYSDLYMLDKETFDRIISHYPQFASHIEHMTRERTQRDPGETMGGGLS